MVGKAQLPQWVIRHWYDIKALPPAPPPARPQSALLTCLVDACELPARWSRLCEAHYEVAYAKWGPSTVRRLMAAELDERLAAQGAVGSVREVARAQRAARRAQREADRAQGGGQ